MTWSRGSKRLVWRLTLGPKTLLYRRGNYVNRRVVPFVERGPFGGWTASWAWGQLGWELTRWL